MTETFEKMGKIITPETTESAEIAAQLAEVLDRIPKEKRQIAAAQLFGALHGIILTLETEKKTA